MELFQPREQEKYQLQVLLHYLKKIEVQTMVIEELYTDKYYLDDYLHFYATCHLNYEKHCRRIHFFNSEVKFESFLSNDTEPRDTLQKSYLGCIVVKPIPTFIGRTLIAPYIDTNLDPTKGMEADCRHIFTLRKNKIHLFGTDLEIFSLSFQEQDQIISACATTALWTVFEKTCSDYEYYWPTPCEITQTANKNNCINREIPSTGLTFIQIINTIKEFGMELEISDFANKLNILQADTFLSECYAYLRGGFPILLGIQIGNDKHAIAILGYELSNIPPTAEVPFVGNRVIKFFTHDDNICPFARYDVKFDTNLKFFHLERFNKNDPNDAKIIPLNYIIPLYHKIQFPYSLIRKYLSQILQFCKPYVDDRDTKFNWEWDCYLSSVNALKTRILNSTYIQNELKQDILLDFYPRFIWVSILYANDSPLFELYADATEAQTKIPFLKMVNLNPGLKKIILTDSGINNHKNIFTSIELFDKFYEILNESH